MKGIGEIMKNAIRLESLFVYSEAVEKAYEEKIIKTAHCGVFRWLEKATDIKLKDKRISLETYEKLLHLNRLAHSINMNLNAYKEV